MVYTLTNPTVLSPQFTGKLPELSLCWDILTKLSALSPQFTGKLPEFVSLLWDSLTDPTVLSPQFTCKLLEFLSLWRDILTNPTMLSPQFTGKIPEFVSLWRDIVTNPTVLSPQFVSLWLYLMVMTCCPFACIPLILCGSISIMKRPIEYTCMEIFFFSCKKFKFHQKIFVILNIFAQNIDCGYTLELLQDLCFDSTIPLLLKSEISSF